jgi:hypothetical protein
VGYKARSPQSIISTGGSANGVYHILDHFFYHLMILLASRAHALIKLDTCPQGV